jgi:hypothetical protein
MPRTRQQWLCFLLLAFASGAVGRGAEDEAPSDDRERQAMIVRLDLPTGHIGLSIRDKQYSFSLNPHLTDLRTRQSVDWNQLALGQLISFVSQPMQTGELQIVALSIGSNGSGHGAAGGKPGGGPDAGAAEVSPFR